MIGLTICEGYTEVRPKPRFDLLGRTSVGRTSGSNLRVEPRFRSDLGVTDILYSGKVLVVQNIHTNIYCRRYLKNAHTSLDGKTQSKRKYITRTNLHLK